MNEWQITESVQIGCWITVSAIKFLTQTHPMSISSKPITPRTHDTLFTRYRTPKIHCRHLVLFKETRKHRIISQSLTLRYSDTKTSLVSSLIYVERLILIHCFITHSYLVFIYSFIHLTHPSPTTSLYEQINPSYLAFPTPNLPKTPQYNTTQKYQTVQSLKNPQSHAAPYPPLPLSRNQVSRTTSFSGLTYLPSKNRTPPPPPWIRIWT
jgi:hypothetical protein